MSWFGVLLCAFLAAAPAPALAGLFDFSEFDDPFSTLANINRDGLFRNTLGAECRTTFNNGGSTRHGVCKAALDCRLSGGQLGGRGSCALQQCCVFEGLCESVSSKKVSYFRNPSTFPDSNLCTFTVKAATPSVCQMRIDYEEFQMADPTASATGGFACLDSSLTVLPPNTFRVPSICGNNDGQHMYIPMNASNGETSMKLRVQVSSQPSVPGTTIPAPRWRIRVTQLECPTHHGKAAAAAAARDFWALAPPGCLQYFTERSGNVSSFGHGRGQVATPTAVRYTIDQNYAICFRRTPDTCGLRLTMTQFQLSGAAGTCDDDYLVIPEGVQAGATTAVNRFCGVLDSNTVITSTGPMPLYVRFVTDNAAQMDMPEIGFLLNWDLPPTGNCPTT